MTFNGLHRKDVESYNDNDNDNERNPIIGPRDWSATETAAGFQAKFGQMSQDILLENVTRHPPSAGHNFVRNIP